MSSITGNSRKGSETVTWPSLPRPPLQPQQVPCCPHSTALAPWPLFSLWEATTPASACCFLYRDTLPSLSSPFELLPTVQFPRRYHSLGEDSASFPGRSFMRPQKLILCNLRNGTPFLRHFRYHLPENYHNKFSYL